jgi:DNA-binding LacI/PurR family transcriptional regulator
MGPKETIVERKHVQLQGMPKYIYLADVLRDAVMTDNVGPGGVMIADNHLMKQYGVSRSTVRQAVDMLVREGLVYREPGRGTFVNPKAKKARELLIEIVGWDLDAIISNRYVSDILLGVEKLVAEEKVPLRIYPVREPSLVRSALAEELRSTKKRTGVMLLWPYPGDEVAELIRTGTPVVAANMDYSAYGACSVLSEAEKPETMAYLVRKLTGIGHRKIAFIVEEKLSEYKKQGMKEGYLSGLKESGLAANEEYIRVVGAEPGTVTAAVEGLLALPAPPTAILVHNEPILTEVIDYLDEKGLRIPEDISVGGVTTVDYHPFYTSMRVDQREMGKVAAKLMIDTLKNPGMKAETRMLTVTFNAGQSFAPPRSGGN